MAAVYALQPIPKQGAGIRGDLLSVALVEGWDDKWAAPSLGQGFP